MVENVSLTELEVDDILTYDHAYGRATVRVLTIDRHIPGRISVEFVVIESPGGFLKVDHQFTISRDLLSGGGSCSLYREVEDTAGEPT